MDDRLFEEMLQEIEAMTTDEYWSLYREAEKLVDFPPEGSGFIPVQFMGDTQKVTVTHSPLPLLVGSIP